MLKMTEAEAMEKLVGRLATVQTGTETIVGTVTTPLVIKEGGVTHVTIEGMVTTEKITGLPHPLVAERAVTLEWPAEEVELLS